MWGFKRKYVDRVDCSADWVSVALDAVGALLELPEAAWFSPDPETTAEGYRQFIAEPMWLRKVQARLAAGAYALPYHFKQDVALIFRNARLFNAPQDKAYRDCCLLEQKFNMLWAPINNAFQRAARHKRLQQMQQQQQQGGQQQQQVPQQQQQVAQQQMGQQQQMVGQQQQQMGQQLQQMGQQQQMQQQQLQQQLEQQQVHDAQHQQQMQQQQQRVQEVQQQQQMQQMQQPLEVKVQQPQQQLQQHAEVQQQLDSNLQCEGTVVPAAAAVGAEVITTANVLAPATQTNAMPDVQQHEQQQQQLPQQFNGSAELVGSGVSDAFVPQQQQQQQQQHEEQSQVQQMKQQQQEQIEQQQQTGTAES
ncbi:hypothetical protein, conserved [Eimeria necatrix]|uniref:Bromo domain-containing protein n=1 Tax=Eimeria necatrix TaxID=51315 RepID=U6N2J5_9EIME|nr:hypothetical protein, conserved [Eimeria necatrix]CDJ70447.1 hypothetical protein, conserved [Eimeria necatrix]